LKVDGLFSTKLNIKNSTWAFAVTYLAIDYMINKRKFIKLIPYFTFSRRWARIPNFCHFFRWKIFSDIFPFINIYFRHIVTPVIAAKNNILYLTKVALFSLLTTDVDLFL
jgi:hypothetical protein